MSFEAMFFDLDDTLYPSTTGIWQAIGDRMDTYITHQLDIAPEKVKSLRESLFHEYGTTLRGLSSLYGINEEYFLDYVHDVPLDRYLQRDDALIETMAMYKERKLIFTNASQRHAERVLSILGLEGVFDGIIDIFADHTLLQTLTRSLSKSIEAQLHREPRKLRCYR